VVAERPVPVVPVGPAARVVTVVMVSPARAS
jgi:hypothetical protein